jgi:signal transduction histidine kinase
MLYQVIVNLLSNAIKYTPNGGRITVAADAENLTHSLHFSVSDTGLGIAPDQTEKVFDKFYRVENYRRVAHGTGLGLNLCRHIVETLHNGQIGVESELGMGSKFWISIPIGDCGAKAAA